MYDKQFIQKMLNFECSLNELRKFSSDSKKKKLFKENMFDQYYDVNTIVLALTNLQQRKVDDWYMWYWTEAYYHLIEDGFKVEYGQKISLKYYIRQRIASRLWHLVIYFMDYDMYDPINIEEYKTLFGTLDYVLRCVDGSKAMFARKLFRSPFPQVLIVNDDEKYFITETYYYDDWDDFVKDDKIEFEKISMLSMRKRIKQLRKNGYKQLSMF